MPIPLSVTSITAALARAPCGQPEVAAVGRVLHRVVQQVDHDLHRARAVREDHRVVVGQAQLEPVARGLQRRAHRLDRLLHRLAHAHRLAPQRHQPAVDARQVEQVVDEAGHVPDLPLDHALRLARLVSARRRHLQHRARVAHRRERVAQLVRQRREELVLAPVLLAQLRGVAHALDVRPAAIDGLVDQRDLVVGPVARLRLVDRHHRHQPAVLHQARADDRPDADRREHPGAPALAELPVDVAHDEVHAPMQVADRLRSEQRERVGAGRGRHAGSRPVVADVEPIAVGLDVGIGGARRVEVLAEKARGGGHDLRRVDLVARRDAHVVEEAQSRLQRARRPLGPVAVGDVEAEADPLAQVAAVDDRRAFGAHLAVLAVVTPQPVLRLEPCPCPHGRAPGPGHPLPVVLVDRIEPARIDVALDGLAGEGGPRGIVDPQPAVRIGDPDDGERGPRERREARVRRSIGGGWGGSLAVVHRAGMMLQFRAGRPGSRARAHRRSGSKGSDPTRGRRDDLVRPKRAIEAADVPVRPRRRHRRTARPGGSGATGGDPHGSRARTLTLQSGARRVRGGSVARVRRPPRASCRHVVERA
jgi:hypothetical protein